jgi:hypothetical protein
VTADVRSWLRQLDETHGEILRGDDDMRRLVREHDAVPALVAALTAVLDLADELPNNYWAAVVTGPVDQAYRDGFDASSRDAAARIRAAVAAAGGEGE